MTLGEKLASLRKEQGYTQEQLAELLAVSRQSVSKWESNLPYPETEKLLRLGEVFHCSMDYLLKDECSVAPPAPAAVKTSLFNLHFEERKSDRTLFGLPLWHIADRATGIFAVGLHARGVVAIGLRAQGVVCIGLLTMGIFSFGAVSLGLVALGAAAVGLLAAGGICLCVVKKQ